MPLFEAKPDTIVTSCNGYYIYGIYYVQKRPVFGATTVAPFVP